MSPTVDVAATCILLGVAASALVAHLLRRLGLIGRVELGEAATREVAVPEIARRAALELIVPIADVLADVGVTADAVTISSLVLALVAGVLSATGHVGVAALVLTCASLGDAIDGHIARRTNTTSVAGALLDASVDRYQELAILAGLAIHLRGSIVAMSLALGAIGGSFMVSYGSAKAEALRVDVPGGTMRRAPRAIILCVAMMTAPLCASAGPAFSEWSLLLGLAILAVGGNVSAIKRLVAIARAADSRRRVVAMPRPIREAAPSGAAVAVEESPQQRRGVRPFRVGVRSARNAAAPRVIQAVNDVELEERRA
jgi:CDP-diacylglycerol--glycerol-3-phosphate 3-phosphatidyltransferase